MCWFSTVVEYRELCGTLITSAKYGCLLLAIVKIMCVLEVKCGGCAGLQLVGLSALRAMVHSLLPQANRLTFLRVAHQHMKGSEPEWANPQILNLPPH